MERAVLTASSRSRGLQQVRNRDLVTLARVMALQVHSDIQWECKGVLLEA